MPWSVRASFQMARSRLIRSESSVKNRSARSVNSEGSGWSIGLSCSHGSVLVLVCWPSLVVKATVACPVLSWRCVDGADVVPVERVDPAPDVHELSMVRREAEALERGVWIGKSLCPEAMDSGVDVTLAFGELAEVEVVGGVGDDVEVGACGERELFGVAVGERVDEVVFGVVDVLGGQWDAGGVSGFGDVGGVSGGGVEVGGVAGSGEGDVAGFAVEAGGADDVDVVAGESLGFVDGGRVAVIDAACLDVVAGEL